MHPPASRAASIEVVVPVYNGQSTIESALRSICRQTLRDILITVVDDGSSDATPEILCRLAAEDSRIRVVTTANRGIVDALNTAVLAPGPELIARFDADDIAFEHRLEVQHRYLTDHPQCVGVGCNVHFIDESGQRTGEKSNYPEHVRRDPFHVPAREPYLLHPFLLVRRQAIQAVGGYRHAFHSEDADLYWRIGAGAGELTNLPDLLGEYRVHSASVSSVSSFNGKVSAVNSQLAALSERRRREGRVDIAFPRDRLEAHKQAPSLAQIVETASHGLSPAEAAYLSIATTAKLLELASYRPYRIDRPDFETMRSTIYRHRDLLTRRNRLRLLLRQVIVPRGVRSIGELRQLMPWKAVPATLVDLAAHACDVAWRRLRGNKPTAG